MMVDLDPFDEPDDFDGGLILLPFYFGQFLYHVFAGLFIRPETVTQRVAQLTAIPSAVLGVGLIVILFIVPISYAMQGAACIGGIFLFCYAAWAAHAIDRAYVQRLEKAEHDSL